MLDIRAEIENKRRGIHYINIKDEAALKEKLKELHDEEVFDNNKMTYSMRVDKDYIVLVLYKQLDYARV